MKTPLLSVDDAVGDHWVVEAVVTPRLFVVQCSCGTTKLHSAYHLLGPGLICRTCGSCHEGPDGTRVRP